MNKDYEVGYCKPPKAKRFVKGKSGNPNGRPPSCLPKGAPTTLVGSLMKELEALITMMEGGRPKKVTKQRALIKNLVNRAMNGSSRAVAQVFKLVREHRVNLNDDLRTINILAERLHFTQDLFEDSGASRMISGLSVEQKLRFIEEFLANAVPYLTGKVRLAPDHPLSRMPRCKMRPSATIADDLLWELRERITITEGGKKLTITKLEAIVKSLLNQAILGDDRAFSLLLKFIKDCGWDTEDKSVIKLPIDSPLAQFIGLGDTGRGRIPDCQLLLAASYGIIDWPVRTSPLAAGQSG
jgi:hypothetical protein